MCNPQFGNSQNCGFNQLFGFKVQLRQWGLNLPLANWLIHLDRLRAVLGKLYPTIADLALVSMKLIPLIQRGVV
ncbi:MAG: hypothetical protein HC767_08635 [Akkermansiaceae bacterium]|nr:hypothetical protein [Akkermansiaceae bacterium]